MLSGDGPGDRISRGVERRNRPNTVEEPLVLIHLVADYGFGDLAFAEVRLRLAAVLPEADVVHTPVPAFDTLSAGFCVGQLALTEGPVDRIVYSNVAPRGDEEDPRPGNEGERLVAARLPSGVLVVGANSTCAFSFVRDEAVELHEVVVPESSSQFRSRDVFPTLIAELAAGNREVLGAAVPPDRISDVPERTVVYVDGYGNLKTSWTAPPAGSASGCGCWSAMSRAGPWSATERSRCRPGRRRSRPAAPAGALAMVSRAGSTSSSPAVGAPRTCSATRRPARSWRSLMPDSP
jgi:hypothetical protein